MSKNVTYSVSKKKMITSLDEGKGRGVALQKTATGNDIPSEKFG